MSGSVDPVLFFEQIGDEQRGSVGGKGLNLARLARAGLPVPPGFVVTTNADNRAEEAVDAAVAEAYGRLGGGPVAVRSSATAEDSAEFSFAGQQETFLGVEGTAALRDALRRCRESLFTQRARSYRDAMGVGERSVAMAVVVQRLVAADAAGVLFTRDPTAPDADRMLVEAAWGLGEAVVSGRVTPDRWTLDRATGAPLDQSIARKTVRITPSGEEAVDPERQTRPALTGEDLRRLAELGRRVETVFGAPQDIEWALADGELWLLQSRPITAAADQREQVRQEEIARLRQRAEPEGTVWARYSLAEVLPDPLPLTWALWRNFMTGRGGYGRMYRELGFDPDPVLDTDGILDLIAGRPYFNLSRDARLYFCNFPQEYPFARLKAAPERAIYPKLEPSPAKAAGGFWRRIIGVTAQMLAAERTLERAAETVPEALERDHFPRITGWAREWRDRDLSAFSDDDLSAAFESCRAVVFDEFAPQALKPSVLAGLAIGKLQAALAPTRGEEEARAAVDSLLTGVAPDSAHNLAGALRRLARGELSRVAFLESFGHRGSGEMELANPRWREMPEALPAVPAATVTPAPTAARSPDLPDNSPGAHGIVVTPPRTSDTLLSLPGRRASVYLQRARRFTALREAAKHHLMLAYEVLRLLLLEIDQRHALRGGIFYLEPEELSALARGQDLRHRMAERRKRRALTLGLEAPRVLFSDDLEAIGRAEPPDAATDFLSGTGVSPGRAQGAALVLRAPEEAPPDARDFILVCPSTDPGWVPLFLRARGVVLETGGILSHGAIVAREFGLPAIVNIAGACARLRTGQPLRIDGGAGSVWLLPE